MSKSHAQKPATLTVKFLWDSSLTAQPILFQFVSAKNFWAKIFLLWIYIAMNNKLKGSNTVLFSTVCLYVCVCVCVISHNILLHIAKMYDLFITNIFLMCRYDMPYYTHTHTHTHTHKIIKKISCNAYKTKMNHWKSSQI